MQLIDYFYAIIMGIVEGLTEFLPISSTGHLILARDFLGFDHPVVNLFIVVIQLGAILAVCWLYKEKLLDVALHLHKRPQQMFVAKLLVAFMPAAVLGLLLHSLINAHLFSPIVVATTMFLGGIVIWVVEKKKPVARTFSIEEMSFKQCLLVGFAQTLAMIPGTSRSGATIIGGLLFGLDRKVATEFSFFLAIPIMFAASGLDLIKYEGTLSQDDWFILATGFVVSFFAALAAVKFFVSFVSRHDFMPFAYYRIVVGLIMLAYFAL